MRIAIASGKGGTGKTTLSVALAQAWNGPVQLLDCDVEAPNASIFLPLETAAEQAVTVPVPVVDSTRCTGCGKCAAICEFNALAVAGKSVLVFEELCHSCGGCVRICPEKAISEQPRKIGTLRSGQIGTVHLTEGRLDIGRSMAPPLIRTVKKSADPELPVLIDCPPGTSCPMITAVKGADFVILVTEPTPFGLHDLTLAVETVRLLNLPFGVVINRADAGDDRVTAYCEKEKIRLLLQIPESRKIAEATSRGESILSAAPELRSRFQEMIQTVQKKESI
ncbi:MAG: ATP-binding protein [Pontiellaceae bacterium]|jgi:MinD superfamily P-loop ATPase|nr:ATP-binding protein [Pontiellaceae bacterium]